MTKKIKVLFVTQHVVHNSTFQAGHQSFNYYLTKFCNDDAFEVGYLVDHPNDASFAKMKSQYANARDFSVAMPWYIKLFNYPFYYRFLLYCLSIINSSWLYMSPFRAMLYKKALLNIKQSDWTPDIILLEWTEVIFLQDYCKKLFKNASLMATEHDVSFNKLYRQFRDNFYFRNFLLQRFKNAELKAIQALDCVVVLSSNDQVLLEANGVDEKKILLLSPFFQRTNQPQGVLKPEVIYYGAMNRPENLEAVSWFLDNVFIPFELYHTVAFTVVGAGLPNEFKEKYDKVLNVKFTGFVENPHDYFHTALCMVVPLVYGGGIKIKVLEAMSSSVTVLSNNIGIEGIKAKKDVSYLHCDEPQDYVDAIMKLNDDLNLARKIGEAGRLMIESNYNFEHSYIDYRHKIIELRSQH